MEYVSFCDLCARCFAWMYQDTGSIDRLEQQAEILVNRLPHVTRLIQTIATPPGSRIGGIVDQACVGRCFAYANYEPASGQFRIRARPDSPLVTASALSSEEMQQGKYIVRSQNLPLAEIYQCDLRDLSNLCIRDLVAGELNGQPGFVPSSTSTMTA